MPSLPNPPRRGQSLADANLPETIARIIDYLRAITPRSSPTVRVSTTSSGTTFRAATAPMPRGGGSMGTWSGMVWILGQLKYDFSRVDADPEGEELDPPGIAVGGVYLVIDLLTQDYSWTSTLPLGPDGYAHKNYYPVGVELSLPSVGFSSSSNRVVGDIRIDMVPYYAPLEEELPSAPPPT